VNIYETRKLLAEYLLFHYGGVEDVELLPGMPHEALGFPARCVTECLAKSEVPAGARALDLGCAVGRSSFELSRYCSEVIGVDFSRSFIDAAAHLQQSGSLAYERTDEGALTTALVAKVPVELSRERVRFEVGEAMALRDDLGRFDVVLMANLIDRLSDPQRCLAQLPQLVHSGGQLIITSPYTWLEEFTPQDCWVGGVVREGHRVTTLEGLRQALLPAFELTATRELPFLLREHARKFQWSSAQASIWRRRQ
jgi:putative 4-mercaptohistidine N1-methyltranferase